MAEKETIQCKNCKRWYTKLMSHLSRNSECQEAYGIEYERMKEVNGQKRAMYLKDYLQDYLKDYKEVNKDQVREQEAEYRATNKDAINKRRKEQRDLDSLERNLKEREYPYYAKKRKKQGTTSQDRILAFRTQIIDGPNFTCYSCKSCLFKGQVKFLKANDISNLKAKLDKKTFRRLELQFTKSEAIFCKNCLRLINQGKIPRIHFSNGLWLDSVPDELLLTDLEQQTIARSLIFMKVKKLPTTRMKAMVDKVISVPIEEDVITKTISALPQHPDDAKIVAVQLKRKLQWKNSHLQEYIRPAKCIKAVQKLKELGNCFYQNITVNENFMDKEEVCSFDYIRSLRFTFYYFFSQNDDKDEDVQEKDKEECKSNQKEVKADISFELIIRINDYV